MGFGEFLSVAALVGVLQFLTGLWLDSRLKASIKAEYDKQLEEYRYTIKVREQAAKAAEYLALAWRLKDDDDSAIYRKVNQLGWELALWLPDNVYKEMVHAIAAPTQERNVLTTLIAIRRLLLKDPGTLIADNIAMHAPNVGKLAQVAPAEK